MAAQYAFVMKDMTKSFPGAPKPVLSNINLQFYQGAKIGIVGPNGAGKSTLMKIMAGVDKDFTGEALADFGRQPLGHVISDIVLQRRVAHRGDLVGLDGGAGGGGEEKGGKGGEDRAHDATLGRPPPVCQEGSRCARATRKSRPPPYRSP